MNDAHIIALMAAVLAKRTGEKQLQTAVDDALKIWRHVLEVVHPA
jgi:hypothetical protein